MSSARISDAQPTGHNALSSISKLMQMCQLLQHYIIIGQPSVTVEKVRLRIIQASACPAFSEFGLFAEPR